MGVSLGLFLAKLHYGILHGVERSFGLKVMLRRVTMTVSGPSRGEIKQFALQTEMARDAGI